MSNPVRERVANRHRQYDGPPLIRLNGFADP